MAEECCERQLDELDAVAAMYTAEMEEAPAPGRLAALRAAVEAGSVSLTLESDCAPWCVICRTAHHTVLTHFFHCYPRNAGP